MAIGAASGLTLGAFADIANLRVGDDFVEDVSQSLTPNKVAVIAEIDEGWTTPVDTRMEALGGLVIRRGLSEVRDELRQAQIAAMKADLAQLKEELAKANAARRPSCRAGSTTCRRGSTSSRRRRSSGGTRFKRAGRRSGTLKKNAAAAGQASRSSRRPPSEAPHFAEGGTRNGYRHHLQKISKRTGWSIFMGILTAAVGVVMILYPLSTAAVSTVFFGSALIIAAVAQLVFAFSSQTAGQFFSNSCSASSTASPEFAWLQFRPSAS